MSRIIVHGNWKWRQLLKRYSRISCQVCENRIREGRSVEKAFNMSNVFGWPYNTSWNRYSCRHYPNNVDVKFKYLSYQWESGNGIAWFPSALISLSGVSQIYGSIEAGFWSDKFNWHLIDLSALTGVHLITSNIKSVMK